MYLRQFIKNINLRNIPNILLKHMPDLWHKNLLLLVNLQTCRKGWSRKYFLKIRADLEFSYVLETAEKIVVLRCHKQKTLAKKYKGSRNILLNEHPDGDFMHPKYQRGVSDLIKVNIWCLSFNNFDLILKFHLPCSFGHIFH